MRRGLHGKPALLLDPNGWADDGATALDAWKPSDDGRYLLYSVQDGGTDWRILRVLDVKTGERLADEVRWAKFTDLAWVGDDGFLYSRFPEPAEDETFQGLNYNQAVYFHRIGTDQTQDELVFASPDRPEANHTAQVTQDGRHVVITSSIGTDARYEVHVIDLARHSRDSWKAHALVTGFDHDWRLVDGLGGMLWFVTNENAPRYRLVSVDLRGEQPQWREIVAEGPDTLQKAAIIGNQLVLNLLRDASSRALIYDLEGNSVRSLSLNGIGTASGFNGRPGDPETFYGLHQFQPARRRSIAWTSTPGNRKFLRNRNWRSSRTITRLSKGFSLRKTALACRWFIVRKTMIAQAGRAVPTILYGYGGFGRVADAGIFRDPYGVAGSGRRLRASQSAGRRRIWQSVARWRTPRQQAECV